MHSGRIGLRGRWGRSVRFRGTTRGDAAAQGEGDRDRGRGSRGARRQGRRRPGVTGVAVALKRQCRADGPGPQRANAAQAQPGRGLRLHELRLAGPRRRAPAHRGVLRERGQGGRRGGDQGAGHAGVLRAAQHRRARRPVRALARPAGPDHPPDGQAAGRHPLRADRLGRGVRAGRRPPERAGLARPRRSSTPPAAPPTRRRSPTSCSSARSAPTTCRTAPTCATSRPASRWPRPSASARPASRWTTCTTPGC